MEKKVLAQWSVEPEILGGMDFMWQLWKRFDMEITGFTQEDFDESFKKVEFFVKEKEIDHIETDEKCPKCGYRW